jgi:hypothetical protein
VKNPGTVDTVEGLARWRLLEDLVQRRVDETGEALRWLVEQGFLETVSGRPGVPTLYRLNAERTVEAKRLIARTGRRRSLRR